MKIAIDSREKPRAIVQILQYFDQNGIKHFVNKLPVGDYMDFDNPQISVDRKQTLTEISQNLCQQHDRFQRELTRALDLGIQLIFLVEHSRNIRCLSDVRRWVNPRLKVSPCALSGFELYRRLVTIEAKYHTEFHFCDKSQTGRRIVELLSDEIITEIERR
jgi:hypothetical protein